MSWLRALQRLQGLFARRERAGFEARLDIALSRTGALPLAGLEAHAQGRGPLPRAGRQDSGRAHAKRVRV